MLSRPLGDREVPWTFWAFQRGKGQLTGQKGWSHRALQVLLTP